MVIDKVCSALHDDSEHEKLLLRPVFVLGLLAFQDKVIILKRMR